MQPPDYDFNKIKFATDKSTFAKAVNLYESGKVTQVEEGIGSYSAIVLGTKPYRVSVEARCYDYGHCTCYLGQKLQTGGVDDSNGTVGGFIEEVVSVLKDYAKVDPECIKAFTKLNGKETCFSGESRC